METTIRITKELFDGFIPAAREPKGIVFGKLEKKINEAIEDIIVDELGTVGLSAIENEPQGKLAMTVMKLASIKVFLHELHSLDIVLTPTGFGVVSSNDTAPASKLRMDALDGEMRVKWLMTADELLEQCFCLEGWYVQGLVTIDTLFCCFKFLRQFVGMQAPLSKDWETMQGPILRADRFLRDKISDEYMDELIMQMATNKLTAKNKGIVHQIRRYIGVVLNNETATAEEYFRRLMNTLEKDLVTFETYANSQAFEVNHAKPYENKQEDSAFHFVG